MVSKSDEENSENVPVLIGLWLTNFDHNNHHFGKSSVIFFYFGAQKGHKHLMDKNNRIMNRVTSSLR